MDHWRESDGSNRTEMQKTVIAHAIQYNLVTRFTSFVAVEEVVANLDGHNNTVPVPAELPAGMQVDKVFGAPPTGTADAFLEALGLTLLATGATLMWFVRRREAGALSS